VKEKVRIERARVDAYARGACDKTRVAQVLSDSITKQRLGQVVKPPDASKTLKKTGAVLLLTPDPVTAIPGAALLGAGYAMKGREAMSIEGLIRETKKTLKDLQECL